MNHIKKFNESFNGNINGFINSMKKDWKGYGTDFSLSTEDIDDIEGWVRVAVLEYKLTPIELKSIIDMNEFPIEQNDILEDIYHEMLRKMPWYTI